MTCRNRFPLRRELGDANEFRVASSSSIWSSDGCMGKAGEIRSFFA